MTLRVTQDWTTLVTNWYFGKNENMSGEGEWREKGGRGERRGQWIRERDGGGGGNGER